MNSMTESVRSLDHNEWVLATFALAFFLLAMVKSTYEKRFAEFINLALSNKYIKVYRDSSNLLTSFTISIFFANLLSISLLIHLFATHFGYTISDFGFHFAKNDWVIFIRIFTLLTTFILIKYLIEKIVVTLFNIEELADQFNIQKVSYKAFTGVLFLPLLFVLFYSDTKNSTYFYYISGAFVVLNVVFYLIILRNFRKIIFRNLFYFILYLCTLEIAPYYFIYYLIKKN